MLPSSRSISQEDLQRLSQAAWQVRNNAYLFGKTAVGCALLDSTGSVFTGCNVEHRYRCHDIHAEVNAISSMVSSGGRGIEIILVAAERERFTPCGSCMDWIFQFATPDCRVAYQSRPDGEVLLHTLDELMPFYPK